MAANRTKAETKVMPVMITACVGAGNGRGEASLSRKAAAVVPKRMMAISALKMKIMPTSSSFSWRKGLARVRKITWKAVENEPPMLEALQSTPSIPRSPSSPAC